MSRLLLALVVLSGGLVVLCLAFWAASNSTSLEDRIPFPGGQLAIGYDDGDFRIGVIDNTPPPRMIWWTRRNSMDLSRVGPGFDFNMNGGAWVASIPFAALVIMFLIPPAWFVLVFQERREYQRRVTLGLCMNCGYDPRGTPDGRPCPECGEMPKTSRFRAPAPIPS